MTISKKTSAAPYQIPSLFTQVQRFDQIDGMARNATRMLGKEIGDVKVEPRLSE